MSSEINFETYLFVNKTKFMICVINNTSYEKIYLDQILLTDNENGLNLNQLNEFLDKNIFKVEKIIKNFIKNIFVILDSDEFFSINLSIKKNNYGNYINPNILSHPLNDLKNLCQSNFFDKKIIHILIENYLIDNKNYLSLPQNLKCNFFSLDVKFICLPKNFVKEIETTLKKYHILLNQIFCASYLEGFVDKNNQNIFKIASQIKSGWNENEVLLVHKTSKNTGFFEKFFRFFS